MSEQTKEAVEKTKKAATKKNKEMEKKEQPYLDILKGKLTAPIPKEAEQIKKFKTFSLTGYKPAYIIERLNECFGYKGWYADLIPFNYTIKGVLFDNLIMIEESCVTVWVKLTVIFADDAKPQSHNQFGTCEYHQGSLSVGEAIKGAYTDGLKKCAGYFDIGQEAYKGNVEPDYEPNQGVKGSKSKDASQEEKKRYTGGDAPTEKQVKFLKNHKIEVPKTKEEASKLINKRFKELDARKKEGKETVVKGEKEIEAKRLAQSASEGQKEQIAHYEEKYPDVMGEVLKELELKNTLGLTVKGAELVINKLAETLGDLGIDTGGITRHEV